MARRAQIFGEHIPEKIKANIEYEMKFIEEMNYAAYFLTVYDIVRYAREQRILCQGRGSAANSTVCYCLGITSVDPQNLICYLNALFLQPAMNLRILMWILNMKGAKK